MKVIDKIAFILTVHGKVLTARSKGKTKFYIPGGKRETGETDEQTLIREVKEELNVTIVESSISYLETFSAQADGHAEGVKVKMTCYEAAYQGVIKATSEIEEIRWLNFKDKEIIAPVDILIFDYLKELGKLK